MIEKCYDNDAIYQWLKTQIPDFELQTQFQGLGIKKDGNIIAACVFEDWNPTEATMAIHMASKKGYGKYWLNLDILKWIWDYPFKQVACKKIYARILTDNTPCLRWAKRAGFIKETTELHAVNNKPVFVMSLSKKHCQWI